MTQNGQAPDGGQWKHHPHNIVLATSSQAAAVDTVFLSRWEELVELISNYVDMIFAWNSAERFFLLLQITRNLYFIFSEVVKRFENFLWQEDVQVIREWIIQLSADSKCPLLGSLNLVPSSSRNSEEVHEMQPFCSLPIVLLISND